LTKENTDKVVNLESLGLCEHCGALLNIEDLPSDAMNAEWRCPKCKGTITNKTFGYEEVNGVYKKIQWVWKGKKWTQRKPTENFDLNNWHITIKPINYCF
jgi:NAD-dependent SIR2 family protein deacetylase